MFPLGSTRRVSTVLAAGVAAAALLFSATPAYAAGGPPVPPVAPQTAPDPFADYHPQNSCSTAAQPGTAALRSLMLGTYGVGRDGGIMRGCSIGDTSEHKEGRAWDWMLSVNDPVESQHAYAVTRWLADPDASGELAGNARRLGIMYMIWNRTIWSADDAAAGWQPYDGPNPHTDHVHFSLSWDGAMGRTSWWTGTAITQQDVGPCRLYSGELAPSYTGPRYTPCPRTSPRPTNAGSSAGLDFDGDRRPDAIAREAGTGRLWLYSGDGNGGTASQRMVGSGWQGMDALVPTRDVSGDGKPDLWARDSLGYLWLYPGDGAGSFTAGRLVGTGWQVMDAIMAAGDVTGDGIPDIWARVRSDGSLRLYPVRPGGTWGTMRVVGIGWQIFDRIVSPGDVTGDGISDLWARRPDGLLMLYPGAAGSAWWGPRVVGSGWDMHDMLGATSDVTGDGLPDLFARNRTNWERWLYPTGTVGQPTAPRVVGWGWNIHDIVI
jgi:hypothetical protein